MTRPITLDIPHELSRDEVRRRIEGGIGKLADKFPGGSLVEHHWRDGGTLDFTIAAMGQKVASRIELLEGHVRATIDLPPMLALFAERIREKLQKDGPRLLD